MKRQQGLPSSALEAPLAATELAIHALAQLPESVELELASGAAGNGLLGMLVDAYGLRGRVRFGATVGNNTAWFLTSKGEVGIHGWRLTTFAELVERIGVGAASPVDGSQDGILVGERIVVVTNYPAHYRLPLFRGMARRLAACGAEMHVIFLSDGDGERPWLTAGGVLDFGHEFLTSARLPVRRRAPLVPMGLERRLRTFGPSIILAAGFSPLVSYRSARVARSLGATFGIWSGETAVMPTARQRGRRLARERAARTTDFSVAYGIRAAAYLRGLRADLPVVIGRNTAPVPETLATPTQRHQEGIELVLIGDLASPRKGADIVIEALRLLPNLDVRLSVIGGGRLLGPLASAAESDGRIRFLGALPPAEVRSELQNTDVFLFPTRSDVFGLVLVEAMGSGRATVVSSAAGVVADLVVDGYNAVVVADHDDPNAWARAIHELTQDPARVTRLGASGRLTIENRWSMPHAVDAMIAGLRLGAACRRVH